MNRKNQDSEFHKEKMAVHKAFGYYPKRFGVFSLKCSSYCLLHATVHTYIVEFMENP